MYMIAHLRSERQHSIRIPDNIPLIISNDVDSITIDLPNDEYIIGMKDIHSVELFSGNETYRLEFGIETIKEKIKAILNKLNNYNIKLEENSEQ